MNHQSAHIHLHFPQYRKNDCFSCLYHPPDHFINHPSLNLTAPTLDKVNFEVSQNSKNSLLQAIVYSFTIFYRYSTYVLRLASIDA